MKNEIPLPIQARECVVHVILNCFQANIRTLKERVHPLYSSPVRPGKQIRHNILEDQLRGNFGSIFVRGRSQDVITKWRATFAIGKRYICELRPWERTRHNRRQPFCGICSPVLRFREQRLNRGPAAGNGGTR